MSSCGPWVVRVTLSRQLSPHMKILDIKRQICTFFFFFFSTQIYFTIFTFLFVTTRQSSTYQQSITDFKVRTLVCIRTLVTSDNTYTPNNAPKATGNGLIQYGTVITRSILLNFSQEITHSLPVRARNGCLLWVSSLIYALLLSVQCCVYIRDKLDRVITAPDLTTQTSTVFIAYVYRGGCWNAWT